MVLLVHRARQVSALLKRDGVWGALRAIWRRLRYGPAQPQYVDVFGHYSFALPHVIRPAPGQSEPGTLLWFIPDFNIGSGGHTTIFRTIWHLEQKGYRSGIVICKPVMHQNAQDARAEIQEHFFRYRRRCIWGLRGYHLVSSPWPLAGTRLTACVLSRARGTSCTLCRISSRISTPWAANMCWRRTPTGLGFWHHGG